MTYQRVKHDFPYGARLGQHAEKPGRTHRPIRERTPDEVGKRDQLDIVGYAKRNQSDYLSTVGFLDERFWNHLGKESTELVGDE